MSPVRELRSSRPTTSRRSKVLGFWSPIKKERRATNSHQSRARNCYCTRTAAEITMPVYNTRVHTNTHSLSLTHRHTKHTPFEIRLCELQPEELSHSSEQRCTVERDLYLFYIPCKVYIDIVNVFRQTVNNAYILTREEKMDNHTSAMEENWTETAGDKNGVNSGTATDT